MSDWVAVISTLIAGVGLLFAGGQLMIMNRAAKLETADRTRRCGCLLGTRRGPTRSAAGRDWRMGL